MQSLKKIVCVETDYLQSVTIYVIWKKWPKLMTSISGILDATDGWVKEDIVLSW